MMAGKWIEYAIGERYAGDRECRRQWTPSDQGTGAALEVEDFDEAINSD